MMTAIQEYEKGLYLIDLDLPREGFRKFISAWLYRYEDATIIVDPGPRSVYKTLQSALQAMDITKIDAVLLTHIHIDHAGGAGLLLRDYPGTRFLCHPKGFEFMSRPARLWEESRKVLRDLADVYGEIEPIPEEHLFFQDSTRIKGIDIHAVDTPGHAPHHLCFLMGDLLFTGEVAGIHYPVSQGLYLRPATPPGVRYDVFLSSIRKVADLPVSRLCFGHYGYRTDPGFVLTKAMGQLEHWLDEVKKFSLLGMEPFEEYVFNELVKSDPLLVCFPDLPKDVQQREKFFAHNAIRGMRQYLLKK